MNLQSVLNSDAYLDFIKNDENLEQELRTAKSNQKYFSQLAFISANCEADDREKSQRNVIFNAAQTFFNHPTRSRAVSLWLKICFHYTFEQTRLRISIQLNFLATFVDITEKPNLKLAGAILCIVQLLQLHNCEAVLWSTEKSFNELTCQLLHTSKVFYVLDFELPLCGSKLFG